MSNNEFAGGHEDFGHDHATHTIGAVAMHDMQETHETIPDNIHELSPERQATYVEKDPSLNYFAVCGDDRCLTSESADANRKEGYANPDEAIRVFGGLEGFSRLSAAAICAQYGPEAFRKTYGDDFDTFARDTAKRAEAIGITFCNHTAEANEGNPERLNPDSEKGLGCAHGANAQLVTELNADSGVVARGKSEEKALFGNQASEAYIDTVAKANQQVAQIFSHGGEKSFNLDRSDLVAMEAPVVVVAGSHASAKDTVVALNFHIDKVSNPREAHSREVAFYDQDVTQIAEGIMKTFPELRLDPRLLMEIIIHDVRPTRKALAGSEGLALEDLAIETYGDAQSALAYLESITQ